MHGQPSRKLTSAPILDCESNRIRLKTVKAGDEDYLLEVRPAIDDWTLDRLIKEHTLILFNDEQPGIVIPVSIKNELLYDLAMNRRQ
jgi:hypothetical protein